MLVFSVQFSGKRKRRVSSGLQGGWASSPTCSWAAKAQAPVMSFLPVSLADAGRMPAPLDHAGRMPQGGWASPPTCTWIAKAQAPVMSRLPFSLANAGRMPALLEAKAQAHVMSRLLSSSANAGRMPALLDHAGRMPAPLERAQEMEMNAALGHWRYVW